MKITYVKGVDTEPILLSCSPMSPLVLCTQDMFDLEVLLEEYMHDWNKCKEEQLRNAAEEIPAKSENTEE